MESPTLTPEQELERIRLNAWMDANGYNVRKLARATDDFYQNVKCFTEGKRRISEGFKWRFTKTFGPDAAFAIFAGEKVMA